MGGGHFGVNCGNKQADFPFLEGVLRPRASHQVVKCWVPCFQVSQLMNQEPVLSLWGCTQGSPTVKESM